MNKINILFIISSFLLVMACGEQASNTDANAVVKEPVVNNVIEEETAHIASTEEVMAALEQTPISSAENTTVDNSANAVETVPAVAAVAEKAIMADAQPQAAKPAVSAVEYKEGTHFERLPSPVATSNSETIEVSEVFWYGCSHCFAFESKLTPWAASLAEDVVVVKSPAMWDRQGIMEKHARIYYTAKALHVEDVMTPATFLSLSRQPSGLRSDEDIVRLFADNGVNVADVERTLNSFGISSAVKQAASRQLGYRVQGTPELVVNGTYRITAAMAGSQDSMLKVANFLVKRIRQEKAQ